MLRGLRSAARAIGGRVTSVARSAGGAVRRAASRLLGGTSGTRQR